ncbi:SidA/IucD/PvdA family monooxygenase [Telluribacter sp. SYSU D00476]|uniref:SidA/IucD/PvdA family monooxygenase n=1 Tax=Telluribacter sp. SYSU D00476 TaxID=2811430 RepID=UPI001FF591A4|nr:NAD(P)/FAD-dependent oxidoreductase [Telluribacter sp. SYSU D00476]
MVTTAPPLVSENPGVPAMITPYSSLGQPTEKTKWWAPLGWLLVAFFSLIFFALFVALIPVMLLVIAIQRGLIKSRYTYHRKPEDLRVAIIGGGWSGLQCLERFKKRGVSNVDVFERYDDIGGTWNKNLRYHGLQIHGNMTVTSFDGLPYSTDRDIQGGKVMAEEVERYIHRFADANRLRSYVQFNSNVDSVDYNSANKKGTIRITDTLTGEQRESGPYDMVIWASMAAFGDVPTIKGAEKFMGKQLHTIQYKTADFNDIIDNNKKVIIVGGGKAACDVVLGFRRAGYKNFTWLMRKPYLFYKYETLFHDTSFMNKVRGMSYLATVLWTGVSSRLGAILHWSSGYLYAYGDPHTDFNHFHGGVLCPTQRKDLKDVPYSKGEIVEFREDSVLLKDGSEQDCDVVIWATGNKSGIDTLKLARDGEPFKLDTNAKLYNHFIVPQLPVMASSTALWTSFGPMRATNSADLTIHHLCVRKERTQKQMERVASRQLSRNSLLHSFIWAHNTCWLQQWVYFHIDLMLAGITPVESFLKHAIEIFVLSKETPMEFNLLPKQRS